MKPGRIDLAGVTTERELVERVLGARMREARALASELEHRQKQGLHDFRIACKRLRYAMERFASIDPALGAHAERLAALQDALGEAHDRDVLLVILPLTMPETERRLRSQREACVDRAKELWNDLSLELGGAP